MQTDDELRKHGTSSQAIIPKPEARKRFHARIVFYSVWLGKRPKFGGSARPRRTDTPFRRGRQERSVKQVRRADLGLGLQHLRQ